MNKLSIYSVASRTTNDTTNYFRSVTCNADVVAGVLSLIHESKEKILINISHKAITYYIDTSSDLFTAISFLINVKKGIYNGNALPHNGSIGLHFSGTDKIHPLMLTCYLTDKYRDRSSYYINPGV